MHNEAQRRYETQEQHGEALCDKLRISNQVFQAWQYWYEENLTEEAEQEALAAEQEEAAAAPHSAKAPPAAPAPVIPAVLQNPPLNPAFLPPREWREEELQERGAEEQEETRGWQEEAAQRHREHRVALTQLRLLQEGQAAGQLRLCPLLCLILRSR